METALKCPDAARIGLIGVGLMGSALATRVLASGRPMVGFDINQAQLRPFAEWGGQPVGNASQVVAASERIILSLPTSSAVSAVLDEIRESLSSRHLLIDTTTGSPADAIEAARRVAARGAVYLEATVSGSSEQARNREAVVLVGGSETALERARDLLELFAKRLVYVGPTGYGARVKLTTNLVLGLNRAALAEGLAFAGALGLDLEQTLAILRETVAYSRVMDAKGEKMVTGDFTPQARLSQHLKDVRLILDLGGSLGAHLPLSQAHRVLLEEAESAGWGELDNSAIIQALRATSKLD
jgi:3-hydroxyisobutyrate dehydrogenase-like beta-hydroxyacid dehydrogenase